MKKTVLVLMVIFFGMVLSLRFFGKRTESENPSGQKTLEVCEKCNLIIIVIDPLRKSNMSMYGYGRKTTPKIDNFSEKAYVYNNAISASSWTLPSLMSFFTGVYPSHHKVTNKYLLNSAGEERLASLYRESPNLKTMADILSENGYKTAAFTGGDAVSSE